MRRSLGKVLLVLLLSLAAQTVRAQKVSVSTNVLGWAALGTMNIEGGFSLAQHYSLIAGVRYNPWTFQLRGIETRNQQLSAAIGVRYWLWYVYSGWWMSGQVQYLQFSNTGIWRPALHEGRGTGAALSAGYTRMIHEHFNIEFGLGFWAGYLWDHSLYASPTSHFVRRDGAGMVLYPNYLSISLMYVF